VDHLGFIEEDASFATQYQVECINPVAIVSVNSLTSLNLLDFESLDEPPFVLIQ
jgi:hypothetical protein